MSNKELIRDEDYYLRYAIFEVENRLFNVPIRYLIEMSVVFRTMFELPQGDGGCKSEGMSDDNPIHLQGVKSEDFKQLLKVLLTRRNTELTGLTLENWISVLHLSTKWEMEIVRDLAIKSIKPMIKDDPHIQLVWGQLYDVEAWISWILDGASALTSRTDTMHEEDVEKIGLQNTLRISQIREALMTREIVAYRQSYQYSVVGRELVAGKEATTEAYVRTAFNI